MCLTVYNFPTILATNLLRDIRKAQLGQTGGDVFGQWPGRPEKTCRSSVFDLNIDDFSVDEQTIS